MLIEILFHLLVIKESYKGLITGYHFWLKINGPKTKGAYKWQFTVVSK